MTRSEAETRVAPHNFPCWYLWLVSSRLYNSRCYLMQPRSLAKATRGFGEAWVITMSQVTACKETFVLMSTQAYNALAENPVMEFCLLLVRGNTRGVEGSTNLFTSTKKLFAWDSWHHKPPWNVCQQEELLAVMVQGWSAWYRQDDKDSGSSVPGRTRRCHRSKSHKDKAGNRYAMH